MYNIPFPGDRGSLQFVKIPYFLPVLLLVADVLGLVVCLGVAFWWYVEQESQDLE